MRWSLFLWSQCTVIGKLDAIKDDGPFRPSYSPTTTILSGYSPPERSTRPRTKTPLISFEAAATPKHIVHQSAPSAPAKAIVQRPSFRFRLSNVSDSPRGTLVTQEQHAHAPRIRPPLPTHSETSPCPTAHDVSKDTCPPRPSPTLSPSPPTAATTSQHQPAPVLYIRSPWKVSVRARGWKMAKASTNPSKTSLRPPSSHRSPCRPAFRKARAHSSSRPCCRGVRLPRPEAP